MPKSKTDLFLFVYFLLFKYKPDAWQTAWEVWNDSDQFWTISSTYVEKSILLRAEPRISKSADTVTNFKFHFIK